MLQLDDRAPALTLPSLDGDSWSYDSASDSRPTLLVFFETDCPTCQLTMPYLNRLATALQEAAQVVAISQDSPEATRAAIDQFPIEFPVVLDAELTASKQFDPLAVPTLFLLDSGGRVVRTVTGFDKDGLNEIAAEICTAAGRAPVLIAEEFDGQPARKPGCTSRHLETDAGEEGELAPSTDIYSRQGKRASRIELSDDVDPYDYCREAGFGDALPVVPPSEERVERMLQATSLPPDEVVGRIPPNYGAATVEKIAANAVMAGCEPRMMRALIPLVRAVCDERFNIHGVQATTHFAAPISIVNGPIRHELDFAYTQNVFSNVARSNSTVGRALQLILLNLGGARPDTIDMSALGNSAKFSCCIAENEEESPWEPLHVESGLAADQSAVTLFACEPPRGISEHVATSARGVLKAVSRALVTVWSYRVCLAPPALVVLGAEHARTIGADGFSKADVRQFLYDNTGVPLRDYADQEPGEGTGYTKYFEEITIDGEPCYRKFKSPEAIRIIVTGGTAGKFSAVLGGWGSAGHGSQLVTYPIK